MTEPTQPEVHHLHELLRMEAAAYDKFLRYRREAGESGLGELCDQLVDRTRQHITALAQQIGVD